MYIIIIAARHLSVFQAELVDTVNMSKRFDNLLGCVVIKVINQPITD